MTDLERGIAEAEEYLIYLRDSNDGVTSGQLGPTLSKADFRKELASTEYWRYVDTANKHYFAGRVLAVLYFSEYALYCGQLCIEVYLKAYLKYKGIEPSLTHELDKLLEDCRIAGGSEFKQIDSDLLEVIIRRYNWFSEIPRYPVAKRGYQASPLMVLPRDAFVLDYFVYQMRRILPIPPGHRDSLQRPIPFPKRFELEPPNAMELFKRRNLNFASQCE